MIRFQVDITTGPITQTPSDTCSTVSDRYTTGQLDHYSKTLLPAAFVVVVLVVTRPSPSRDQAVSHFPSRNQAANFPREMALNKHTHVHLH